LEGTKEWVPLPAGYRAPVGSGATPPKPENYAENLTECQNSILLREKIFCVAISEGDMSPLSPLPYAPG